MSGDERRGQALYAAVLLMQVQALSYLDRGVVNILAEPIKREFGLRDWQLGALTGTAFGVFYAVSGIPLARWAQRTDRVRMIAGVLALWSLATVLSGLAGTFMELILARLLVGIGEGGLTPAAHSLLSDLTPKERRGAALSIYAAGISAGGLLSMVVGGVMADLHSWRSAFFLAGAPGLFLAGVVLLSLEDPFPRHPSRPADLVTFRQACATLLRQRFFLWIAIGAGLVILHAYARSTFIVSFYLRTAPAQVAHLAQAISEISGVALRPLGFLGLAIGLSSGVFGMLGALTGAWISHHGTKRSLQIYVDLPLYSCVASIPFAVAAFSTSSVVLSLSCVAIAAFIGPMGLGGTFAAVQCVASPNMRAMAAALLLLTMNLIGLACGPLLVGLLSDGLGVLLRDEALALRWALIASQCVMIAGALCLLQARREFSKLTLQ